jgi:predicted nucleic acid-binding protein
MVRPDPALVAPIRDPNDTVVLQTAIIGGAEAICTTDEDFPYLVFTDMELMGRLRS